MTAAPVQADFDFAVSAIVGAKREMVTLTEACQILGYERSKLYELAESGRLEVHRDPHCDKSRIRFTRRSITAWLLKSAEYQPADIVGHLLSITRTLTARQRADLIGSLQRQAQA